MTRGSHEKSISRAASVVGSATVVSRVLGYTRDAAIAFVFGAGLYSDAFFMAFRISNLLRRLLGEGALTSSIVPIFTEELSTRPREAIRRLVSSVFTLFAIILAILTVVGIVFSEEIVRFMSPGFVADPEKFSATVRLTQLMFPYMVFVGLMAIAMGALNSVKHFAAPAVSPVFFNLSLIFSLFAISPYLSTPVYGLAYGVLLGGFFQFVIQLPYLRRHGFSPKPGFHFKDPAIKKVFLLMGPAAFGVGVYQLNIFVTLWFSSQMAEGAVSYLYYAGRLMELPLGVFGVAISTAALPSLSEHVAKKDWDAFRSSLSFAVRLVNFVTIPAMAGLFVLSYPIIDVLFRRGEFGAEASYGTAIALYYYAIGLVPVAASRILSSVFYSLKDTKTPVYVALAAFAANVFFCFVLAGPLGYGGLALATSLSSIINAVILVAILRSKFGPFGAWAIFSSSIRSAAASALMGGIVYLIIYYSGFEGLGGMTRIGVLISSIGIGTAVYLLAAAGLRCPEIEVLKGVLKRRR